MLYILLGENSYARQHFLADLKKELGLLDTDATMLSGTQLTPAQLANTVTTIPFFVAYRLVIVEGLLGRFEPRRPSGEAPSPELAQAFIKATQTATSATSAVLVLVDEKASAKNPLYKSLKPVAKESSFPLLRGEKLRGWIQEQVKLRGGTIEPEVVNSLANIAGNDLWALSNEIDKLLLYSGGKPIQEAHIQQVVAPAKETNIFHLVDALLQRRPAVASRRLHELLSQGMAPSHLITLIARQLRFLVLTQEFLAQRLPERDMQQRLGLQDFAFRQTLSQARKYRLSQLIYSYRLLLDTDLAIKTGRQDDEVALDMLVAEMSSNR